MPVSLIGAAIVMFALGFSLNLLTILAIVLSVGLVVGRPHGGVSSSFKIRRFI
jgi:hypothetical protein